MQLLFQQPARAAGECGDAQVSVAGFEHARAHAADLDNVADDVDLQRLRLAFSQDFQRDLGAGFAPHQADGFGERQPFDRLFIDLDDQVARLDTRALCRRVINRRDHTNKSVLTLYLNAEAAELAGGRDGDVLELVGIQIRRVRVQARQHAANRRLQQRVVVNLFHVVLLNAVENLHKGLEFRQGKLGCGFAACKHAL